MDRSAERDAAIAEHKAAVEAQEVVEVEPVMVGYDETQPGQEEVVTGTVEHVQLLNSYANASSYGPDVNVVVPPPPEGGGDPQMVPESAVDEEVAEEREYGR